MSRRRIGVAMIGCGTVGSGVAKLLAEEAQMYAQRLGAMVELRRVLVRDTGRERQHVPAELLTDDADDFFLTPDVSIVVEVAGGRGVVSQYVRRALSMGRHVVTANKALLAAEGPDLYALGRQHKACIAFEASCGGAIPIITSLKFGLMANRVRAMYGILNGTCNFILTAMSQQGQSYEAALAEAQARGFAEADPTLDVSGRDAAQKLGILASLAFGARTDESMVWCEGIDSLDIADIRFGQEMGYEAKLLAIAEVADGPVHLSVRPCFIHEDQPLSEVHGSFNALSVYGHAAGHTMYLGRGAGQMPTASAVVSDVLNVASGWYPQAFASMNLWPDSNHSLDTANPDDLVSRFYLRFNALDAPGTMAKLTRVLGESGIGISAVRQHESARGQFVPVVIITHAASQGPVRAACKQIAASDVVASQPVMVRIVDLPQE